MKTFKVFAIFLMFIACLVVLFLSGETTKTANPEIYKEVLRLYSQQTNALNAVCSIYLNYRIFDTIFEALMLLVSVMGVVHFSRHLGREKALMKEHFEHEHQGQTKQSFIILIVPVVFMLGVYLVVNGHISPGGGFQGGAALSAAMICVYLVRPMKSIRFYSYEIIEKNIFLIIAVLAGGFACSNLYLKHTAFNVAYLTAMNVLIGAKVYLGLTMIFFRFVHFEDK